MTDAEYEELKYAAIAAGYKPVRLTDDGEALLMLGIDDPWNPRDRNRHSDHMGDALRLAVRLNMGVSIHDNHCIACAPHGMAQVVKDIPTDKATCLAITRAAAEIGKQMGGGNV